MFCTPQNILVDSHHIDWVDGAKGIAIVCVILEHCLPQQDKIFAAMHIGQAVPIFIFITAYLTSVHYRSFKEYFTANHLRKMLRSVLPPFLMVLLCEIIVYWYHYGETFTVKSLLISGGCYGPGSYYLYIYLSLWFMLPFIVELVRRTPLWLSFLIMLGISVASEYFFSQITDSRFEKLWRILPVRYFMITWLGCAAIRFSDKVCNLMLVLAVVSGLLIIYTLSLVDAAAIAPPP